MTNEQLEITLKTLTPIWTGGADGSMDRLHETSIIGSLRWWYEAIVRGLGGHACDPTQHTCIYDTDKANNGLCDVCQLFGTTGWRRRFRLVITGQNLQPIWTPTNQTLNVRPPNRNRGWYLPAGQMGTLTLRFIGDSDSLSRLVSLLLFMEKWGSIGAKPQLGYGLFQITAINKQPERLYKLYKWDDINKNQSGSNPALPALQTFTFFTLNFIPQDERWWRDVPGVGALDRDNRFRPVLDSLLRQQIVPVAPALKNLLRYGEEWSSGALPHQFFGTLRHDTRLRSKIALSWAYRLPDSSAWQIRGWAYPPQVSQNQQQEIQRRLQAVLGRPETWLRALNVRYRSAEVSFAPTQTFFQPITMTQVQQFICETLPYEMLP